MNAPVPLERARAAAQARLLREGQTLYRRGAEALRGGDLDAIAAFQVERRRDVDRLREAGRVPWSLDDPEVAEARAGLLLLEEQLDELVRQTMDATRAELVSLRQRSQGARRYR